MYTHSPITITTIHFIKRVLICSFVCFCYCFVCFFFILFSALLFCSAHSYGLWHFNCCLCFINENNCQSSLLYCWFVLVPVMLMLMHLEYFIIFALSFAHALFFFLSPRTKTKLCCSPQQFVYLFVRSIIIIVEITLWKSKSVFKCNNNSNDVSIHRLLKRAVLLAAYFDCAFERDFFLSTVHETRLNDSTCIIIKIQLRFMSKRCAKTQIKYVPDTKWNGINCTLWVWRPCTCSTFFPFKVRETSILALQLNQSVQRQYKSTEMMTLRCNSFDSLLQFKWYAHA